MIPDRTGQVWEGMNSDDEVTLFLFLRVTKKYRYKQHASWNDWMVFDIFKGRTCTLRMWRDSPLENPSEHAPKWRRVA